MNQLYQEINDALYHAYYGIQRIEEEELKKSRFNDLTPKELHAVDAITMYEHPTTSQVAEKLHLSRATMTVTVDRLVRKGYVERIRGKQDRRIVHLKLTMRGRVVCLEYNSYHNRIVKSFLQNLYDYEFQTIYHAFKNLDEFLNSH